MESRFWGEYSIPRKTRVRESRSSFWGTECGKTGTAVIGLALGSAMAQPMSVIFFDVEPSDPTVYAAIILTLGLAGFLACLIPARRATQIELVDALRPD